MEERLEPDNTREETKETVVKKRDKKSKDKKEKKKKKELSELNRDAEGNVFFDVSIYSSVWLVVNKEANISLKV